MLPPSKAHVSKYRPSIRIAFPDILKKLPLRYIVSGLPRIRPKCFH